MSLPTVPHAHPLALGRYTADLIVKVTQLLNRFEDAEHLIEDALDLLSEAGFLYAALKVEDPVSGDILIRFASGLTEDQKERGRYKIGEGITGTVFQSGEAIVVESIAQDSRFLNRTGIETLNDGSFFCFPMISGGKIVGVLSTLSPWTEKEQVNSLSYLMQILTPLLSQSIQITERIESDRKKLQEENSRLRAELSGKKSIHNFVGNSSKMHEVYEQIRIVASSNTTVLILGANGTGKELVADAIHYSSPRAQNPFVKVNVAALPENLLESELFGHEKGAFTGAHQAKKGRVEVAEGGTLFLDEIGEMPLNLQSKLLRFLQAREFERVGSTQTQQSNVRIIAATNRDLMKEVREGRFREDLYYRLNVFPIFLPSLAERQTDIVLLADHFLEKFSAEQQKNIRRLSTPAIDLLTSYHWPGNVRELENCMERAVLVCQTDTIRAQDLPPSLQTAQSIASPHMQVVQQWSLPQAVENLEKEMIIEALKTHNAHQGRAAMSLGITERQMGYKIRKYNIVRMFSSLPQQGYEGFSQSNHPAQYEQNYASIPRREAYDAPFDNRRREDLNFRDEYKR